MRTQIYCDWCGKQFERYPCQIKKRNYCSRDCMNTARSKVHNPDGYRRNFNAGHLVELNRRMNPGRMTPEVREKLRQKHLGSGTEGTYAKYYSRHEHRVVAEEILGRPLIRGEVVHHIDGNKRNNRPENLMIFRSQAEHARFHKVEGVIL